MSQLLHKNECDGAHEACYEHKGDASTHDDACNPSLVQAVAIQAPVTELAPARGWRGRRGQNGGWRREVGGSCKAGCCFCGRSGCYRKDKGCDACGSVCSQLLLQASHTDISGLLQRQYDTLSDAPCLSAGTMSGRASSKTTAAVLRIGC